MPSKVVTLLQRLSLPIVICVADAWALEYVASAMLNSMGVREISLVGFCSAAQLWC